MQKRLISQNIMQCANQSSPQFSTYGSFVAYKTDKSIKIKSFNKQIKQLQIKTEKEVRKHFFATYLNRLLFSIEYVENNIQIYELQLIGLQLKHKLYKKLEDSKNAIALKHGITYISQNKIVKQLTLQNNGAISVCECPANSIIVEHQGEDIFILCPLAQSGNTETKLLKIYHKNADGFTYQQNVLNIDYIKNPLAIYKNYFIFQQNKQKKQIEIYNITLSKMIGKFTYEGELIQTMLKGNILLIVASKQNMDKYYFYTLNTDLNAKNLLSHRCLYQKGKGSYFQAFSCTQDISDQIIQGKSAHLIYKNNYQLNGLQNDQSALVIYVLPAKKAKIQITRISNNKIKEQAFKENQTDHIIISKTQNKEKGISQKKIKVENQQLEIQKVRINSSMSHRKSEKSIQEIQRKIIDHIVEIKVKGLLDKFDELQKRLIRIQDQIVVIYARIQKSIQNINKQEIKRNVQNLFEKVTPQFESYFKQVFRQISGVLDQGMNYYTEKLAKQSQTHRQAFSQIVNMAFDATQQIVDLGRKQLQHSQKTSESLQRLLQIRKKWESQAVQFSEVFKTNTKGSISDGHDITLGQTPLSPDKQKKSPQTLKKKN